LLFGGCLLQSACGWVAFFAERKAHLPLEAGAEVEYGVGVQIWNNRRKHSGF